MVNNAYVTSFPCHLPGDDDSSRLMLKTRKVGLNRTAGLASIAKKKNSSPGTRRKATRKRTLVPAIANLQASQATAKTEKKYAILVKKKCSVPTHRPLSLQLMGGEDQNDDSFLCPASFSAMGTSPLATLAQKLRMPFPELAPFEELKSKDFEKSSSVPWWAMLPAYQQSAAKMESFSAVSAPCLLDPRSGYVPQFPMRIPIQTAQI